jgi:hypothetical protein
MQLLCHSWPDMPDELISTRWQGRGSNAHSNCITRIISGDTWTQPTTVLLRKHYDSKRPLQVNINVSEEYIASIFGAESWRQFVPPKRWYLATSPHDVSTEKTKIDIQLDGQLFSYSVSDWVTYSESQGFSRWISCPGRTLPSIKIGGAYFTDSPVSRDVDSFYTEMARGPSLAHIRVDRPTRYPALRATVA